MKIERIQTNLLQKENIINSNNFSIISLTRNWLDRLNNKEVINLDQELRGGFVPYALLYACTNIDFIGWQVYNNKFNWEKYSWALAKYRSKLLDPDKYNWEKHSWAVIQYCPWSFNPEKYNWKEFSSFVAYYNPNKLDPDKYNWDKDSWAIAEYCPRHLDPDRYNWKKHSRHVIMFCPDRIDPNKFNWEEYMDIVVTNRPGLVEQLNLF